MNRPFQVLVSQVITLDLLQRFNLCSSTFHQFLEGHLGFKILVDLMGRDRAKEIAVSTRW